jgi:hypothetical protein
MGALNVFATILAVRLILLVAVSGAIWLSWLALGAATASVQTGPLVALSVYVAAVVVPLVWLASRR